MRAATLACTLAALAAPPVGADPAERQRVIEQKAALVARMLAAAGGTAPPAGPAGDEARALLAQAEKSHERGRELAALGRYAEGEIALDAALAAVGRLRRVSPEPSWRVSGQKARYEAVAQSTGVLLVAARRNVVERATAEPVEMARGAERLARAAQHAQVGQFDLALREAMAAEGDLLAALRAVQRTNTIDYTPRFETVQDELRHEMARYDEFLRLVPIALAELKPASEVLRLVDDCVLRAGELHAAAQSQVRQGNTTGALSRVREAADWLQRALATAGLVVPAS